MQSRSIAPAALVALLGLLNYQAAAAAATVSSSVAASQPAAQHFDVDEYRVLGNTLLTNRQIEGVLYPRLGPGKTFADVQTARAALEAAYHALGYATVFVDIPPQEVTEGIVRLHVTEGRLRERTISGARYFSEGKILAELPATQPGTVPRISDLQQQLNAVNAQTADRSVVPILKAGPVPGTTDLALKVEDHLPLHGSLEVNNQDSPDTKPLRVTAALSYNNLFDELDSVSALYTTAPQKPSEVGVLNLSYGFHPVDGGLRPTLSFTNSSSNVATVGTLGVLGDGQVYGGRLVIPVIQLPGDAQSVTLGLDYKHFRNTINLASSVAQIEPMSYVNASISYAGAWQRTATSGALQQLESADLAVDFGPRGAANGALDFANSRYQARGNYAYLHSDGAFMLRLPASLQLTLRATGQVALEPLVVYEQDAITGAGAVRGYLEAEVLGDTTVNGTVQLQSPPITRRGLLLGDAFVFFDAGRSRYVDPLSGEPPHTDLSSTGAGLDLFPGRSVTGSLTWADPLADGPRTRAHSSRVLFDLKGSF